MILETPGIEYCGNITIGRKGKLSLDDLRQLGFQAIMVTAGAQGTKSLGLPGEDLVGVYHAKDLVYHYNKLPPFSTQEFLVGGKVALIGVGNVSMDIAHWVIRDLKAEELIIIARRGPAEVKFSKKEMEYIIANLDLPTFEAEMERVRSRMEDIGQDVQAAKDYILSALPKAEPSNSDTLLRFIFMASPTKLIGDAAGKVSGLELEDTYLALKDGEIKARSLGTTHVIDVNSVVFCIGDRVDEELGLPVEWNEFVKNPAPRFAVDGNSYEAFDTTLGKPIEDIFVAGWSREASSGLVGTARKDGENGARAVLQYLRTIKSHSSKEQVLERLRLKLNDCEERIVSKSDVKKLDSVESTEASRLGLEEFKMKTNEEMLAAIDCE